MTTLIRSHIFSDHRMEVCTTIGVTKLSFLVQIASFQNFYHLLVTRICRYLHYGDVSALPDQ